MRELADPITHDTIDQVSFDVTEQLMMLTGMLPDPSLEDPDGTPTEVGMIVEAIQAIIGMLHDSLPDPPCDSPTS